MPPSFAIAPPLFIPPNLNPLKLPLLLIVVIWNLVDLSRYDLSLNFLLQTLLMFLIKDIDATDTTTLFDEGNPSRSPYHASSTIDVWGGLVSF